MNTLTRATLWTRLREAALVEGDVPPPDRTRSPWYVRVMLGIGGWIGALFLLGFVGVGFAFVVDNAGASVVVGAIACAGAAAILLAAPRNDFMAQFGLAVGLAGQALLIFGFAKWFGGSTTGTALIIALQQAALFVLVPNFIHRLWCAWTAAFAATYAMMDGGLYAFAPAAVTAGFLWVWLSEFEFGKRGALARAGGYGLALATVQNTVIHGGLWAAWLLGRGAHAPLGGEAGIWLGNIASGAVLVWAVLWLLRREGVPLVSGPRRIALAGAAILALISLRAPGVGPAAAILVVGYANGNRVLAGLGVFALLGYLSHYYYSLQATLLAKSVLLACAGLALLAVRLALHRWWPEGKEAEHA